VLRDLRGSSMCIILIELTPTTYSDVVTVIPTFGNYIIPQLFLPALEVIKLHTHTRNCGCLGTDGNRVQQMK
jgi:hypothetical protein